MRFQFTWRTYLCVAVVAAAGAAALVPVLEPGHPRKSFEPGLLAGVVWQQVSDPMEGLILRADFNVPDPSKYVALELEHPFGAWHMRVELNDHAVLPPLEGLRYSTIPAIDAGMLVAGANRLVINVPILNYTDRTSEIALRPLEARDLRIVTGPVLGEIGPNYVTVTCRTNMPAEIRVLGEGGSRELAVSPTGVYHRLRVPAGPPGALLLAASNGAGVCDKRTFEPVQRGLEDLRRMVLLGDSRVNAEIWAGVAAAAARQRLQLAIHSGDFVTNGLDEWNWDRTFFGPSAALLAESPMYAIYGNHENDSPMLGAMFSNPSEHRQDHNWWQRIGRVLLIGVDGLDDWLPDGAASHWLRQALHDNDDASFIFLVSHYPPSDLGEVAPDGLAVTRYGQPQQAIVPLLEQHKATAMMVGHDHCYERIETPGGLTIIVSGGAGAHLYKRAPGREAMPYTKAFAATHHYCLLEIEGDTCTLQALTPEGELLDKVAWLSRRAQAKP